MDRTAQLIALVDDIMGDVPNKPKTPGKSIRLEDDLWNAFVAKANREGTNATAKIRAFVESDLAADDDPRP